MEKGFVVTVLSLLVVLVSQMYPTFLPALGKVLEAQIVTPVFWLTIIVVTQSIYIFKLKGWLG